MSPSAEFAPNAFSSAPQYAQEGDGPKWYDRLMNLVLGEDETLPKNRLALICHHCRLVNGQAPPGVQRLEDVGKWRCAGCGTMDGEEKEEIKLLKQIKEHGSPPKTEIAAEEMSTSPGADTSEDSEREDAYVYGESEELLDGKFSGSEDIGHEILGAATGAQDKPDSTRRRSKRVQNKAKG